jgi:uncharacterized protein YuzE
MDRARVPLRASYDASADAAYIYFAEEPRLGYRVAATVPLDPVAVGGMVNLDLDDDGRLIGIEVLEARSKLPPELLLAIEQQQPPNPS